MKKIILMLIVIFITISALHAQTKMARIFFVNLYNQKFDVRLGEEDDYIFIMEGLDPYQTTYMLDTRDFGEYELWFKLSGENEWYYWADNDNVPFQCPVQSGKTHCIITDVDGYMSYYTISEEKGPGARVCFFNGTASTMSRMEVGTAWGDADAFTEDLESYTITNFVTIDPGKYQIYWQFPDQVADKLYYYFPDESSEKAHTFDFKAGKSYLFLAYTKNRGDYAIPYCISQ